MTQLHTTFALMFLAASLAACVNYSDNDDKDTDQRRAEVREQQENSEEDLCEEHRFYGDGVCDSWCPQADPDCDGEPCGDVICGDGQVCCNESCGICAAPDEACITLHCGDVDDGDDDHNDNGDGDDDHSEPGDGEPCGDTFCGDGQVCCNDSCGICTAPDEACIQIACEEEGDHGEPDDGDPEDPNDDRADCNEVTCGEGQVCCNFSCSICTEPDEACTQQLCE